MQVIELLAGAHHGLSLAAMTESLQIPKTSLLNHLRVLVNGGYASLIDGRYTLGPAALRLGVVIASDVDILAAARPVEVELAAASGETAMIAMLDQSRTDAVCIDVVDGPHDIRYSPRVGSRWPLFCTGMGRALLAFQGVEAVRAYLGQTDLSRRTAATVIDTTVLQRSLDEIRSTGFAITAGEHTPGAGAVAAPIFERDQRVRHVIAVGVPVERLSDRRELLCRLVVEAAHKVSWTLGGAGPLPSRRADVGPPADACSAARRP